MHSLENHSSCLVITVTPLDVVKIRMQAQQKEFLKKKCFLYCNGLMEHLCYCNGNWKGSLAARNIHGYALSIPASNGSKWFMTTAPGSPFNGTIDAFARIVRNEGITSLWSGLPPTLVMALPATMVYFTMYDQIRSKISHRMQYSKDNPDLWVSVVSGGSARTISATLISPLELVRTKMQSKKLKYSEVWNAVQSSVKQQGVRSLWRGLGPTILRDVPFSALYWLNYEFYKKQFNQTNPSFAFSLAAGAASGTVCAIITLPFDVVKTHRQIDLGEKEVMAQEVKPNSSAWKQTSTFEILKKIHAERGIPGLFSGITPRVIKVAPACAIMISTYEYGKTFFRKFNASPKTFLQFLMEQWFVNNSFDLEV